VANAEVLPFDWRATAEEFAGTLQRYAAAMGDAFDFAPVEEAVGGLSAALDRFYAAVEAGTIATGAANAAIQRLARILVPVNYTREPRFRHDPAFTVPPLPALAVAAEYADLPADQRGFALTQLLRGRNVVTAALKEARHHLEAAIE
jgi:hypothetical protein